MNGRLDGKVAIVTGAGTGAGEAIAHKFAQEGARLILNGLPDDPLDDVARAIAEAGGEAITAPGDVSDDATAQHVVKTAIDRFGKLDVLVNNAGVFLVTAELDIYPVDVFDETIRMNVRSAFLMTKYALPHLKETHGNIVSAGSEAGFNGEANNAPYGGTKGFMHAFMKGVAVEQGRYGIRANCVCPGPIDTAWTHKETGPMDEAMERNTIEATVLGRRGTATEIANVYAFLASDEASYVTGALWLVDGGTTGNKGPTGARALAEVRQEPAPQQLPHALDGLRTKNAHALS